MSLASRQPPGHRRELKYLVKEEVALEIRNFIASNLEIDEFGACCENLSYPVHSLYLDSDDLSLYWDRVNGSKNRYKLRLRYYSTHDDAPVYFELKQRVNDAVLKQRGGVRRQYVGAILAGQGPSPEMLTSCSGRHLVAIQRFCDRMAAIKATPKAHVAYTREAWADCNGATRVTIDRHVQCAPEMTARLDTQLDDPVQPFGAHVVVEIKFTGRFPNWLREMTEAFGLLSCSVAKYADGVEVSGEDRFHPLGWVRRPETRSELKRRLFLERLRTSD